MGFNTRPPVGFYYAFDWILNVPGYGQELGRSNYLAVGGAFGKVEVDDQTHSGWARFTGIYTANSATSISQITDGTSNTLAFGEYLGGLSNDGTRFVEVSWMGAGWLGTKWGLAPTYGSTNDDYNWGQFQSKHSGVVNFAFADGHVAGISRSADFNAFVYSSGMADGQVGILDY